MTKSAPHSARRCRRSDEVIRTLGLDPAQDPAVLFPHLVLGCDVLLGRRSVRRLSRLVLPGLTRRRRERPAELDRQAASRERRQGPPRRLCRGTVGSGGNTRDVRRVARAHRLPAAGQPGFDAWRFTKSMDYCLTVRGTVGIEAHVGMAVLTVAPAGTTVTALLSIRASR